MIQPLLEARAKKCTKFFWFFGGWENSAFYFRYLLTFSRKVVSSWLVYYSRLLVKGHSTYASNFSFISILIILGCATNWDMLLLTTLLYKGKGGMKNHLKVLKSFNFRPFMQKYNWPPITQLKTPQFGSDQPRSLETKVHPSITNEVTWITVSFCSYSDWEYASSSYPTI